jgi:hypothetical protein
MNYDITFCDKLNCENKNCERNQDNLCKNLNRFISISSYLDCKYYSKGGDSNGTKTK